MKLIDSISLMPESNSKTRFIKGYLIGSSTRKYLLETDCSQVSDDTLEALFDSGFGIMTLISLKEFLVLRFNLKLCFPERHQPSEICSYYNGHVTAVCMVCLKPVRTLNKLGWRTKW